MVQNSVGAKLQQSRTCLAAARFRQVTKIQLRNHSTADRMNMAIPNLQSNGSIIDHGLCKYPPSKHF